MTVLHILILIYLALGVVFAFFAVPESLGVAIGAFALILFYPVFIARAVLRRIAVL